VSKRKKKKTVGDQVTFVFPYEDDKIIYDWLNAQNNATNALRVLIKEVIRVNGGIFDMSTGVLDNNSSPLSNKHFHVPQYHNDYSSNENIVNNTKSDSVANKINSESVNKKESKTSSTNNEDRLILPEEKKNETIPKENMDNTLNDADEKNNNHAEQNNEENNIVVNLNDLL
jgi:hypothetical protein